MKDRLILLCVVVAFAFLGVETRYLHAGVTEMEPVAWVPAVTAGVAILLCLLGLIGDKKMNRILGILMLILSLTGLVGFYFHHGGDFKTPANFDRVNKLVSSDLRTDRLERMMEGEGGADPPPDLAPLSYTGLCLLAGVVLLVTRKEGSRVS